MSADKRSVSTDALETLGTIITEAEGRDAIHLAVENVVAAQELRPGEDIGFVPGGVGRCDEPVGIVDPFLTSPVLKGQRFWLVVYPRKITSLRHVWSHPAFPEADVPVQSISKSAAEIWMRKWAVEHMGYDYYGDSDDTVSEDEAFASAIRAGHEHHIGPHEDARDHIDNEWWSNWEAITGEVGARGEYFSCSC